MKRPLKILFASLLLAVSAQTVYPCSCEFWKAQKKLRRAHAVFVGEVVEIGVNDRDKDWLTVSIKFKVDRYWKGIREPYITVVSAPPNFGSCGLPVQVGSKFLIYGFKQETGQLEVDLCSSEQLDSELATDELKVLGRAKVLKPSG